MERKVSVPGPKEPQIKHDTNNTPTSSLERDKPYLKYMFHILILNLQWRQHVRWDEAIQRQNFVYLERRDECAPEGLNNTDIGRIRGVKRFIERSV